MNTLLEPIETKNGKLLRVQFTNLSFEVTRRLSGYCDLLRANGEESYLNDHEYLAMLQVQMDRNERINLDVIGQAGELAALVSFSDRLGMLDALWIGDSLKGQGVGRQLVQRALTAMRQVRIREAEAWVGENNGVAQKFFAHTGWQATPVVVGETADYRRFTYTLG